MMKEIPLSKVYRLIEPGPVVLVTTAYKGRANIMRMTYYTFVVDGRVLKLRKKMVKWPEFL